MRDGDRRSQPLNEWLAAQQASVMHDIGRLLDIEAGLHEILLTDLHTKLINDIRSRLDLGAGLTAIVEPVVDGVLKSGLDTRSG
jgi:hypothetical protein